MVSIEAELACMEEEVLKMLGLIGDELNFLGFLPEEPVMLLFGNVKISVDKVQLYFGSCFFLSNSVCH